ncbi:MAG: hypothetical protein IKQ20_11265 [Bacteroidales bacterium]|nr:hypothetical protein [Bacteroidales bacterium]
MKKIIFFVFFLLAFALNAQKVAQVPYYSDFEATSWRVEYGLHGFTPGTGSFHTYSIHPCTLANLSSSTTYDIYIFSPYALIPFLFFIQARWLSIPMCVNSPTSAFLRKAPIVMRWAQRLWLRMLPAA